MKNLKKVLVLLVFVVGIVGLWSHVLGFTTNNNDIQGFKTPLLRFTYVNSNSGYINQEYQDGSFKLIKPATNEYICFVGDDVDETHDFTNREDMDNFFVSYYQNHRNLNMYGL